MYRWQFGDVRVRLRCSEFSLEVGNPSILGINLFVLNHDFGVSVLDLSILALCLLRFSN